MSLQFIIGGSGTGKSHYAFETIIREAASHPDVLYYIVVPEQFTMQTQQTVVEQSPGKGILNIDVLSFQRLAYRVFEEVGGDTRTLPGALTGRQVPAGAGVQHPPVGGVRRGGRMQLVPRAVAGVQQAHRVEPVHRLRVGRAAPARPPTSRTATPAAP